MCTFGDLICRGVFVEREGEAQVLLDRRDRPGGKTPTRKLMYEDRYQRIQLLRTLERSLRNSTSAQLIRSARCGATHRKKRISENVYFCEWSAPRKSTWVLAKDRRLTSPWSSPRITALDCLSLWQVIRRRTLSWAHDFFILNTSARKTILINQG